MTRSPGRDRTLDRPDALPDRAQRVDEERDVEAECREGADRDVAGERLVTAVPEHDERADQGKHLERRQEDRVDVRDVERRADDIVGAGPEARRQRRLGAEALHDADAGDRLLDERGRLGEALLVDLRPLGVALASSGRSRR